MRVYLPVKKVNTWGRQFEPKSLDEFWKAIGRSGQFFGANNHPDPNFYRSLGLNAHNGIDIPIDTGTEILASHDGLVIEVSNDPSPTQGLGVVIWDKEQKLKSIYWHNLENKVVVGQEVKQGQIIALSDNTGLSTGPHLHWGIKLTDDNGNTLNRGNGYDGALDPRPLTVWWDSTMDKVIIKARQLLEGYKDESGQIYWADKPERSYLIARIKDKIKDLTEVLEELNE